MPRTSGEVQNWYVNGAYRGAMPRSWTEPGRVWNEQLSRTSLEKSSRRNARTPSVDRKGKGSVDATWEIGEGSSLMSFIVWIVLGFW